MKTVFEMTREELDECHPSPIGTKEFMQKVGNAWVYPVNSDYAIQCDKDFYPIRRGDSSDALQKNGCYNKEFLLKSFAFIFYYK